ncbi:MAG: biopolymer transporter Tol [Ignavibacteriales bacterium]|nr:MAG: biopolymer transporter Tol [Ignavibacteriales bacterium]
MRSIIFTVFILLSLTMQTIAQFGQNKVQYKEFDWYYIQTKHFDIYFTSEGTEIAEFTAKAAEEALESIQESFDYLLNNRISLIVYNSHNDFQETNTTGSYLSQGVGGFTEPFKNRVVFPFEGSYDKFRHVIHHELVHAVMRDMLYGGTLQNIIAKNITLNLPHWYHEGMAEYEASGWETNTDMFIRDAIMNENLPDINRLSGYWGYRGGQSVMAYIARTYGREKIGEILHKSQSTGSLQEGLKASIGLDFEELNERWRNYFKKQYWPEIEHKQNPDEFAKRLTNHTKDGGFYYTSPAISPQGDKIVFISDQDIYLDIYLMDANTGKITKKIIESGRTPNFEELNILYPSLTWSPDNKTIALSLKSSGFDRIYTFDTDEEEFTELPFKLDGIESVNWSSDGTKLVFVGANAVQSDLYVYNLVTKELINLTNDIFSESDPRWSVDNETVFFSSDRGRFIDPTKIPENLDIFYHNFRQLDLYAINSKSLKITRLTDWELSDETSAISSPDGKEILFVSDKSGITNLYRKRISLNESDSVSTIVDLPAYPLTNSLNGIEQISTSTDGKKLVFSSLYKSGYNIFMLNNPFEMKPVEDLKYTKFMKELIESSYKHFDPFVTARLKTDSTSDVKLVEEKEINLTESKDSSRIITGQYVQEDSTNEEIVDYSRFVFGESVATSDSISSKSMRAEMFSEKLDDDGNFLLNRYKIDFSPDLIYANAGYSTMYGVLGTTVLSFSDVLGNHRLVGITSLQIDLKNSDYGLAYYYLPKRINYGIEGFHTARFVYLSRPGGADLFRFRNFGGIVSASLPINRFYRIDGSLGVFSTSSENLDDFREPSKKRTFVIPSISFVHDNVLYGYTSPIEGTRYKLTLFGNPGIDDGSRSFYSLLWDYRTYLRFWFDNHFAIRFSGGYSAGANPQRFFIGGTDNWVNRQFATGEVPIEDPEDFAFFTPGLPLRGYDYAQQIGTKYSLLNLELRMPLIRYLLTGPLPLFFQNILGTAFVDVGSAWNNNDQLQFFTKNNEGNTITKDLLIGTGFGFRVYFIFLWRIDVAWSYNVDAFSTPRYYFSIGLDF